jgi:mono/diheme cytochrome c family protein
MLRPITFTLAVGLALSARAEPFTGADTAKGKMLAEESCVACHSSKFGVDATKIYTRPDHRIKSADQLLQRVTVCTQAAEVNWSKEDIRNVAAYLNQAFYKFP